MSSYSRVTKHPRTGKYEPANWLDDYFGPHQYAVQFPDGCVYPAAGRRWEFVDTMIVDADDLPMNRK